MPSSRVKTVEASATDSRRASLGNAPNWRSALRKLVTSVELAQVRRFRLFHVQDSDELGADLVEAAFVRFAFRMQDGGNFRARFQVRLSLLLDFNVDHFLQ
jgi:hypothetical protein